MITKAQQCGEWWLMPASEYKGKIPPEVLQNLFQFLQSGIPYQGFIIAEDMKVIEKQREQEALKRQNKEEAIKRGMGTLGAIVGGLAMGFISMLSAIISLDPMLLVVTEDSRWICLGTWYE